MNICFRCKDPETEKAFLNGAEAQLLQGLKGRKCSSFLSREQDADSDGVIDRSVGGVRASN